MKDADTSWFRRVDPEIYENHPPRKQDSKDKEEHRNKLGFSCVLVEKFLDKEG